jgi:hypothetical protein
MHPVALLQLLCSPFLCCHWCCYSSSHQHTGVIALSFLRVRAFCSQHAKRKPDGLLRVVSIHFFSASSLNPTAFGVGTVNAERPLLPTGLSLYRVQAGRSYIGERPRERARSAKCCFVITKALTPSGRSKSLSSCALWRCSSAIVHHEKLSSICHHRRESCDNLSVQKTGVDQPPRRGDQTPQTRRASTQ